MQKLVRCGQVLSLLILAGTLGQALVRLSPQYAQSDFGRDDLCGTAYNGDLIGMRLLLYAGANPNRVGWEEHFTPLAETARSGQVEAACLLLAWGANPNAPNDLNFGKTALSVCPDFKKATKEQEQVVALLKKAGGQ